MSPGADEDYRLIGRYVVKFSEFIADMRSAMVQKLSEKNRRNRELAQLALSETSAAPLASSFFAMCVHAAWVDWDSPDGKIIRALSDQVHKAIRKRNDVVHGDWQVMEALPIPGILWRTDARRKVPFAYQPSADMAEVKRLTEELIELQGIVKDVGNACLYAKFELSSRRPPLLAPAFCIRKVGAGKKAESIVVRKQPEAG